MEMGDRISTIPIKSLSLSCVSREDMKIRNDLYLLCFNYNGECHKGHQWSYDAFYDFVRHLDSLLMESDIEYLRDHVY